MEYLYLKALHLVFVITWFSGMFYLGRLLIYNREAQDRPAEEKRILSQQYQLMISRLLYIITLPSAFLTLLTGLTLIVKFIGLSSGWLHLKLFLLVFLYLYHISLHVLSSKQAAGRFRHSSTQLRMWNEVPTVFLVAIVFLAVVRQGISAAYGVLGLFLLVGLLMSGVLLYKRFRKE
jgi:putative membrane protein